MKTNSLIALTALGLAAACGAPPPEKIVVVSGYSSSSGAGSSSGSAGGTSSGGGTGSSGGAGASSSSGGGTSSGGGADGGTAGATGVPCDVATMLAANCTGCHSDPPAPGALAGLVTYADLKATSHEDATKNEAQLSLTRMQSSSSPMPPTGVPPAADVATLQNWINAGYPTGSCATGGGDGGTSGGDGGGSPPPASVFSGAPPFSSQTGQSTHNAGQDCMNCHAGGGGDAPSFVFGGTLYDGKGSAVAGAEVRFVDATGTATSVYTSNSGTFYSRGSPGFAGPAHVGVRNAAATQEMLTGLQSSSQPPASTGGACSACHCSGSGCTMAEIHLP